MVVFLFFHKVINYIENDESIWENEPFTHISSSGQLAAFFHNDFGNQWTL